MSRPDSGQIASAIGTILAFAAANFDRIAATLCALVGIGYTIWKWRREARQKTRAPFKG